MVEPSGKGGDPNLISAGTLAKWGSAHSVPGRIHRGTRAEQRRSRMCRHRRLHWHRLPCRSPQEGRIARRGSPRNRIEVIVRDAGGVAPAEGVADQGKCVRGLAAHHANEEACGRGVRPILGLGQRDLDARGWLGHMIPSMRFTDGVPAWPDTGFFGRNGPAYHKLARPVFHPNANLLYFIILPGADTPWAAPQTSV